MGTQLFSQFPVVFIFFHSFLWYLVIQHLKDFRGSALITLHVPCLETQQIHHVGDHSRGGEPCPEQSTETLRMTQKRSWNSKRSALFHFPFFPLLLRFIDKTKEHQKKKWNMISPCTCHPATNPSTRDSASFIYSPSASSLPRNNGNLSRQIFAMILFHS